MIFSPKVVARYRELKAQAPDCLLPQVRVFMTVTDEDARAVAQVTGLRLQAAGEVGASDILGGFPLTGLDAYTSKLVHAGHSVAITLQDEQTERDTGKTIRGRPANGSL